MSIRIISKSIWSNPGNRGQRCRRMAMALSWQAWKRTVAKPRSLVLPNGRHFAAHPDCVVSSSLIYAGYPEYHELMFVRAHLKQSDLVIDVGANVGHIGLLLSDLVNPEHILAFEPTPITFERLRENWSNNGFPLEGLFRVALGDSEGEAVFPDLKHPGTMNRQVDGESPSNHAVVTVNKRRLDSFRDRWRDQPLGLLKVDVEGHEADVLRGARQTLRTDRPRLVMFESLESSVSPEVSDELVTAEYVIFQLDKLGRPTRQETGNQNLFATPVEHIEEVLSP